MNEMMLKALQLAVRAHKGQRDKAGKAYILHPLTVAVAQKTADAAVVGLLHDVVEDSEYTMEDLKAKGFPLHILAAVDLLTHKKGMPYADYIAAIKENDLACSVKLADLAHNMDLTRIAEPTEKDMARRLKYEEAVRLLTEE